MDGSNVWARTEDPSAAARKEVYFGYGEFSAVRTDKWLYFQQWRGDDRGKGPMLFDLEADPEETQNVLAEHPAVGEELRGRIGERFQAEMPIVS
jgi:hypothetical protein